MQSYVNLVTYDKQTIKISRNIAMKCEFIKQMIEDYEESEIPEINLLNPNCKSGMINKIMDMLERSDNEEVVNTMDIDDVKMAAKVCDYLDIKDLLDVFCNRIATLLKSCKSHIDIKEKFKVKKDFTEEDKKKIEEFFKVMN
eukprot:755307-Hanusia_phi.AAC.1